MSALEQPQQPPAGPPPRNAANTPRCPTCQRWLVVPRPPERRAAAAAGGPRKKGEKAARDRARIDCIAHVRLTAQEREDLEKVMTACGYTSKQALLRWLIRKGLYNL